MIARHVHKYIPIVQVNNKCFDKYIIESFEMNNICDLDSMI